MTPISSSPGQRKQVKTIDVEPIPQRIFDGMAKYENAARGYNLTNFERIVKRTKLVNSYQRSLLPTVLLPQVYRLPADPSSAGL
jgi:hypothetical protein